MKIHNILTLTFILFTFICFSQDVLDYSTPRDYEIGGVTVSGTKHLNDDIIIKLSGLTPGKTITVPGEDISKAIRTLWKQGLFADVQIYVTKTIGDRIFLDIVLTERPRLSKFTFRGLNKGAIEDVRERIRLLKGKIVTENLKINAINAIEEYLVDKGYLNASIEIVEKPDTSLPNSIILFIYVDKGNKVKINNIKFSGNDHVDEMKLRNLMKNTKERTHFSVLDSLNWSDIKELIKPGRLTDELAQLSPSEVYKKLGRDVAVRIFNSSKYKKKEYKEDLNNIIYHYNSLGYRDATIKSDTILMTESGDLNIKIDIDEGYRYYFRDIAFEGNTKYADSTLRQILGIEKGDIYNMARLERQLYMNPAGFDISSLYMDNGYLFFQVNPVEVQVQEDSIDIEIQIYEGAQATINKIIISGNTKTHEHVIRRELRTLPGSKFSRSEIIRSQREIANLGYFDPEKIEINPIPHPEKGTVDIEYKVVEKPSDQVQLQAGYGGRNAGLIGTLALSFNNFSVQNIFKKGGWNPIPAGEGQKLSLRVQSNARWYRSANFSFTEPWLGGKKPNALSVSVYQSLQTNGGKRNSSDFASLTTTGGAVALGKRLSVPDDFFTLQSMVSYQHFKLNNWRFFPTPTDNGSSNNLSIKETFMRNSIDQPTYPRKGSSLSLSMQLTPPYSLFSDNNENFKWIEYHKWRFNADWYTAIAGDLVLKASAKMGFLGRYNSNVPISPFERFQLGGDGISNYTLYGKDIISLRGYEVSEVGGFDQNSDPATIFNKFTVEMRYPITLKPMSTIYALIFAEGGNAWKNANQYNPYDLKRSVGFGMRFYLPMFGLLGFDYGIGFDKNIETDGFGDFIGKYGKLNFILGYEPE